MFVNFVHLFTIIKENESKNREFDNMTKKNIELQVDVQGQFKLLRQTAFKDPLSLLDEDIQNADRAGAKHVRVTFDGKDLIIENDGKILNDPEVLFTMGKSGWDEDVKEAENPFGMGFFSNIPASNFIEVFSGNLRIVFDEREVLTIYSETVETFYDGFKLILHNFQLENFRSWHIEERVELLGKHIHNMDIFYNGKQIEKKSLTEGDGLPFELPIEDDELFMGWLSLSNTFYGDSKVKVFYKGRYVTSLDDFFYIKGEVHVNDKALTLQSPDRKDIIKNEKFSSFKRHLRIYAEEMAEMAILKGKESDIVTYQEAIGHYIKPESIRYRMPFSVFDGKTEDDVNYLANIALALSKNDQIKTIGEYEVFLRKQQEEEQERELTFSFSFEEKMTDETPTNASEVDADTDDEGTSYSPSSTYYAPMYISSPTSTKKKKDTATKTTEVPMPKTNKIYLSKENEESVFWVKLEELLTYKKRIQLIKEYGIKLIVAQNKIEESILERSYDSHVHHIKSLEEKVTIKSYISNTKLSLKEQRAAMLLDMISRMYEFENNVFCIGDVMVTKLIEVPQLQLKLEKIEEEITVVANKEEQMIFVDRAIIENSMLSEHTNEEFEVNDYKFLLLHLKQIIDEFSLLEIKENKDVLYEKTLMALAIA